MRSIAHISDLHFGHEDPELVGALLQSIKQAQPDVVVVSGDLTQRAKKRQFRAARAFLQELPEVPRIVVPGNHDVSATNLMLRVMRPLERYKRFISAEPSPSFVDEEIAIAGIDTVRAWKRKDGRINRVQVETACAALGKAAAGGVRVVVTHHPMDLPMDDFDHELVSRSAMAMHGFAECRVDLFLSGHLHTARTLATRTRYGIAGHSAVVAQAGSAISTRTRGEPNAWNLIRIDAGVEDGAASVAASISIQPMVWSKGGFAGEGCTRYRRVAGEWVLGAVVGASRCD
jgi:3',5'-cyclic AMP phosphodiesterase CpdA